MLAALLAGSMRCQYRGSLIEGAETYSTAPAITFMATQTGVSNNDKNYGNLLVLAKITKFSIELIVNNFSLIEKSNNYKIVTPVFKLGWQPAICT